MMSPVDRLICGYAVSPYDFHQYPVKVAIAIQVTWNRISKLPVGRHRA